MIKSDDIIKIKELGYDYITSIGKPSIRALIKNQKSKVEMTLFDEDLKEVIDKENNKRYILRLNPIRRDEIRKNMEEKIESLKKFINTRIEYYNTHFKAKKETLEKDIDKKISNLKLSSFISCNLSYKDGDIIIVDKDKKETTKTKKLATTNIAIDEAEKNIFQELDGCYIIKTSLMDATKDSKEDIHKAYKTLIKVENAFKTLKTDYLEIRPLYLKTDKRIIGHVALSMIAYNIVLKLKEYINLVNLDFKSTIAKLSKVQTINNKINDMISFETIPEVCDNLKILFSQMKFKLSTRI